MSYDTLAKAAEQPNDPIREKLHALKQELLERMLAHTGLPRTKEGKKERADNAAAIAFLKADIELLQGVVGA